MPVRGYTRERRLEFSGRKMQAAGIDMQGYGRLAYLMQRRIKENKKLGWSFLRDDGTINTVSF